MIDDEDALLMAEGVLERVMAKQFPGRPAFHLLTQARQAIRKARDDIRIRSRGLEETEPLAQA
jgi:hypothetical protein